MTPTNSEKLEELAARLTPAQRRLIMALPDRGAKKWRAQYRHAKVRGWTQLPFSLAQPTLTGSEFLTDEGRAMKRHLRTRIEPKE